MRMVRAGERPSADAAAMSEVVLNGAGRLDRALLLLDARTTRAVVAPSTCAMTALASASTLKRAVACGASNASGSVPNAPRITQ